MRRSRGPRGRAPWTVLGAAGLAVAVGAACGGGGGGTDTVVVAGTIPAAGSTAADSDVNDPDSPYTPNDTPQTAQGLPNPVTVGGYVNVAGTGPGGRSGVGGDPVDVYAIALAMGQSIRLVIAEDVATTGVDLDLRLLDASEAEVAVSDGTGQSEEISVPSSGAFFVEVSAVAGASSYVLTLGQTPTSVAVAAAAAAPPSAAPPREEFVPGEVIVRYRDDLLGPSAAQGPAQRAAAVGMRHLAGRRGEPQLVAARAEGERRQAFQALGIGHLWSDVAPGATKAQRAERLRQDTRRLAKALRRRPDVAGTSLDYIRRPSAVPADELYPLQWHYGLINLPQAWDAVSDDSGVVVAVLDTGIRAGHPEFTGQLVDGYDFIQSPAVANDGDGCDADETDAGDDAPGGSSYHGTHVAGTVAARTSLEPAGDTTGVAGVAWNARVLPVRVLGKGGGTDYDIMGALLYAVGRGDNSCGVANPNPAQVINMSFGGPGYDPLFQDLVADVTDPAHEGAILVAAAGNESSTTPSYPAGYDGVISVSAVGPTRHLAPYSNFGPTIDVAAPGGDFTKDVDGDGNPDGVLSTWFDETEPNTDPPAGNYGYALAQGTSMAAPHVAGVIALMLDVNPDIRSPDVFNLLNAGQITDDIGDPDFFGNGLIDAVKAVNAAAELADAGTSPVVDPVLRVNPDALSFGLLFDAFTVSVTNGGGTGTPLQVLGTSFVPDVGGAWLSVTAQDVDADGLGTYDVTIDRSGLADGVYTGTLTFESDANDVDVPILMEVGDPVNAQSNAGHHFVLLVEEGTLHTVRQVEADAVKGVYHYRFEDVPPGRYQVVAGTDMDNDRNICDPGEACGAYPTLETIVTVEVPGSHYGLDFVTGFQANLGPGVASASGPARRGWSRDPVRSVSLQRR